MFVEKYDTSSFVFQKNVFFIVRFFIAVCVLFLQIFSILLDPWLKRNSFSLPTKIDTFWLFFLFFFLFIFFTGCIPLDNTLGNGNNTKDDTKDGGIIYEFHCHPGFLLNARLLYHVYKPGSGMAQNRAANRPVNKSVIYWIWSVVFSKTFESYRISSCNTVLY